MGLHSCLGSGLSTKAEGDYIAGGDHLDLRMSLEERVILVEQTGLVGWCWCFT